jgi:hypothetical protein
MFRFLIVFGLAAIVLMLIVAYVRGRRSGGTSGRGYFGESGSAIGWSTDWDRRSSDSSHSSDPGDWGDGGSDGGSGGDGGGGGSDGGGGGSDGGGGGGD